jgi:hypothetical protein
VPADYKENKQVTLYTDLKRDATLGDLLRAANLETGLGLGDLTVLSTQNDPYRIDTETFHQAGRWLREQMERTGLLTRANPIHNRRDLLRDRGSGLCQAT